MKKIFTLMIALFSLGAVFAQYGHEGYDQRSNYGRGYDQGSYYNHGQTNVIIERDDHNGFDGRDRFDMQRIFDNINFMFNSKIERVQCNPYLNWWQKERIIRNLQMQRNEELSMAHERMEHRDGGWKRY